MKEMQNNKDKVVLLGEEKKSDYHLFQIRESYMDVLIDKTKLNQSEFKGFFNLVMTIFIIYVFTLPILNYINH